MSDLSNKRLKKQRENLEKSIRWLRRAQMDLNAFKKIAPSDRNTHKIIRCSDPALGVYLLQQSIEKTTKAVAAATGKYSDRRLMSHGHNSLDVLLGFYREILTTITNHPEMDTIGKGLGLDFHKGLNNILNLMIEV